MAAAQYADGKLDEPPPELTLANLCGTNHLPDEGGIMAQDYNLLITMRTLQNVVRCIQHMRGLTGDAINTNLSTSERLLLGDLQKMGALGGISG